MSTTSTRVTAHGAKARLQRTLNVALRHGSLRERMNGVLARANLELVIRQPADVVEPEFERYLATCREYTMTSRERMYAMFGAARYLAAANVPGDIVEVGVWRGGSSMMAGLSFTGCGDVTRRFWLYDTFEGMPAPDERDFGLHGENPHSEWHRNQRGGINEWCYAPLDEVRANMLSVGVRPQRLELVQGKVEETLPGRIPEQIALLRLDTDWYSSTYHELVHLFPRLAKGGVLILDDYGQWGGVRDATDRYFAEQDLQLLLTRIDYAARLAIRR